MRILFVLLGLICVSLGALGTFVPLLPTVPFMLLAAFFFARSSKSLHLWLISHKSFGPAIINWQSNGAISRKAKILAVVSIGVSFGISGLIGVPIYVLGLQFVVLAIVLLFILSRPEA